MHQVFNYECTNERSFIVMQINGTVALTCMEINIMKNRT